VSRLKGDWAIIWSDDDGDHMLGLRAPPAAPKPAANIVAYTRDSLDRSQREVLTIGSGVHEVIFDITLQDASQTLLDMLLAGVRGKTLTLTSDVDDPDRGWDCDLIEPTAGQLALMMDGDSGEYEWHQATVRLRRTNGKPFNI
jgi:hypothetical protein